MLINDPRLPSIGHVTDLFQLFGVKLEKGKTNCNGCRVVRRRGKD